MCSSNFDKEQEIPFFCGPFHVASAITSASISLVRVAREHTCPHSCVSVSVSVVAVYMSVRVCYCVLGNEAAWRGVARCCSQLSGTLPRVGFPLSVPARSRLPVYLSKGRAELVINALVEGCCA